MPKPLVSICHLNLVFVQIPIVPPAEAAALASKYRKEGFTTLKLKVGKNLKADIEVLQAIRVAYPDCSFILDANEGYRPQEAIEVLEKLHGREFIKAINLSFCMLATSSQQKSS